MKLGEIGALPRIAPRQATAPAPSLPESSEAARRLGLLVAWVAGRPGFLASILCVVISLTTFAFLYETSVPIISAQDEGAMLQGGRSLLSESNVRVRDELNDTYDSNLVGNTFASYRTPSEMYYRSFPGSIVFTAALIGVLGEKAFYLSGPVFGALAVAGAGAVSYSLTRKPIASLVVMAVLGTAPVFVHWSVNYFNNVPVLALQVWAMFFLFAKSPPGKVHLLVSGSLVGVAIYVRSTEMVFAIPFLLLAGMRGKTLTAFPVFIAPLILAGAALLITNMWLYGSAFYQPHLAPLYLSPGTAAASTPESSVFLRYLLFLLGAGSLDQVSLSELLANYWFHLKYLLSSSFASPLLLPSLLGLGIAAWRDWPGARALSIFCLALVALIVVIYGNQAQNYYGYGQQIVRSSFVRYSLPFYAFAAIGIAPFLGRLLDASDREVRLASGAVAIAIVLLGGHLSLQASYDESRYGLDRLNRFRLATVAERQMVNQLIPSTEPAPLLIVGSNTSKVIDTRVFPHSVDIAGLTPEDVRIQLLPLIDKALKDRPVTFIGSGNEQDNKLLDELRQRYKVQEQKLRPNSVYSLAPK